jgi:hypothetical protein
MIAGQRFRLLALALPLMGCADLGNGWNAQPAGYAPGFGNRQSWWGPYGYGAARRDDDRYRRTDRHTVCDQRTQTCYKNGNIDASETRDQFGNKAGKRADNVRDDYGSNTFVRSRDVACDRGDRVCYKKGRPDRSETRDVFGKKAARKVD